MVLWQPAKCWLLIELAYIFKHLVKKVLSDESTWVIRQSGICHRFSRGSDNDTWLFVFPNRELYRPEAIEKTTQAGKEHFLMSYVAAHFPHLLQWWWYMADCEKSFTRQ